MYIYFQRELRSTQTPSYVRKSLVGQLLMADISNPPDASLLESFEKVRQQSRQLTPDFSTLFTTICTKSPHLFGNVVVLLDAFDECDPRDQVTIAALIETFITCGIRTYVTTRPHNKSLLPKTETQYLQIAARDEDVQNYVRQEIKRRKIELRSETEESIIRRIGEGVGGM